MKKYFNKNPKIIAGIDIGTHEVKVVIAEEVNGGKSARPEIIGTGKAESQGLRYGYIINSDDVTRSVRHAVNQAEKIAGVKIKDAYISMGGISLEGMIAVGHSIINNPDSEIRGNDIEKSIQVAEGSLPQATALNRRIIHAIPISHKIDGEKILGRPIGVRGNKLETTVLFISCMDQHLQDLIEAVENAEIEVRDVVASPLAGSLAVLTKAQKIAGCVLANIGAETLSIIVYEDNVPISLKMFPIGSIDITKDIALGLKIPLEEAEKLKTTRQNQMKGPVPKKRLDEIIMARISDMFELIGAHLVKIGKNGLLPAGIIISGGGSGIATIEDLARAILKLPSSIAETHAGTRSKITVKNSSWAVAYGMCIIGLSGEEEEKFGMQDITNKGKDLLNWLKQFLP